jgi:hypothetical protein
MTDETRPIRQISGNFEKLQGADSTTTAESESLSYLEAMVPNAA